MIQLKKIRIKNKPYFAHKVWIIFILCLVTIYAYNIYDINKLEVYDSFQMGLIFSFLVFVPFLFYWIYYQHKFLRTNVSEIYSTSFDRNFIKKKIVFKLEYSKERKLYTIKTDLFERTFSGKTLRNTNRAFDSKIKEEMVKENIDPKILEYIDKEKYFKYYNLELVKNVE